MATVRQGGGAFVFNGQRQTANCEHGTKLKIIAPWHARAAPVIRVRGIIDFDTIF